MKKFIYKLIILLSIFCNINLNLLADTPFFLDFKYILNQSDAGKKAQTFLKNKLEKEIKELKEKEKKIQEQEKKIISQKKVISEDEYKKKVSELRKKVSVLQNERKTLLNSVAAQRKKAKRRIAKKFKPNYQRLYERKN